MDPDHVAFFERKQPAADIDRQDVLVTPAFAISVLVRTEPAICVNNVPAAFIHIRILYTDDRKQRGGIIGWHLYSIGNPYTIQGIVEEST